MQTIQCELDLELLRKDGPDALYFGTNPRIRGIRLREVETAEEDLTRHVTIHRADDLFDCPASEGQPDPPIPETGHITRAVLEFQLSEPPGTVTVQIITPDTVSLSSEQEAEVIQTWLSQCRFAHPAGRE